VQNIETTDITELEVVKLAEGQAVTFTANALPDVTKNGVVTPISQSSFVQGRRDLHRPHPGG